MQKAMNKLSENVPYICLSKSYYCFSILFVFQCNHEMLKDFIKEIVTVDLFLNICKLDYQVAQL